MGDHQSDVYPYPICGLSNSYQNPWVVYQMHIRNHGLSIMCTSEHLRWLSDVSQNPLGGLSDVSQNILDGLSDVSQNPLVGLSDTCQNPLGGLSDPWVVY